MGDSRDALAPGHRRRTRRRHDAQDERRGSRAPMRPRDSRADPLRSLRHVLLGLAHRPRQRRDAGGARRGADSERGAAGTRAGARQSPKSNSAKRPPRYGSGAIARRPRPSGLPPSARRRAATAATAARVERALATALKFAPRERWPGLGRLFAATGPFAAWIVAVADGGAAAPRVAAVSPRTLSATFSLDGKSALADAIRRRTTVVRSAGARRAGAFPRRSPVQELRRLPLRAVRGRRDRARDVPGRWRRRARARAEALAARLGPVMRRMGRGRARGAAARAGARAGHAAVRRGRGRARTNRARSA